MYRHLFARFARNAPPGFATRAARLRQAPWIIVVALCIFNGAAAEPIPVTPEMLSGPLNFFASPGGLNFAEPIPYGVLNNDSDQGWIWPNDNSGYLAVDFGTATALGKFRVYSVYSGGQRGAIWAIQHSLDNLNWVTSTNFLFQTSEAGGVDEEGSPRPDYGGWYEITFNPAGEPFRYWRITQTEVTQSHAPRSGQVEF
jgi:hypothetical protein